MPTSKNIIDTRIKLSGVIFEGIISWQEIHCVDREINRYFWLGTEVMLQEVRDYYNEGTNTCEFLSN